MNEFVLAAFVAAIVGGLTASLAVPVIARVAMAVRAVDYPGGRRFQGVAIPRMGGIAIAAGIGAGGGLSGLLFWHHWRGDVTFAKMAALLLGAGLIFLIGLTEDVIGLSPIQRFLVQVAAAMGVVAAGWSFDRLYVPFWREVQLGLWGGVLTIAWITGVTNAINLLDGLDGLAGGVAAIIAASLLVLALIQQNPATIILMAAMVGACLGFLRHNWAPARIYMGDSGSLTLGFLLAVMSMRASIKGVAAVAILVPILALGLPVIDTLLVMAVRFVRKPQGPFVRRCAQMFQADRNHVHHLMERAAPERKYIVLAIYFVAACFCGMALAVAVTRNGQLGIALIVIEVVVVLLMRWLGVRQEARVLSLEQRREVREKFVEMRDRSSRYAQRD
jgi:UDP-GlcNAc:undecaprenyl-phosphate GlcNAc-1-phosphate transferase